MCTRRELGCRHSSLPQWGQAATSHQHNNCLFVQHHNSPISRLMSLAEDLAPLAAT